MDWGKEGMKINCDSQHLIKMSGQRSKLLRVQKLAGKGIANQRTVLVRVFKNHGKKRASKRKKKMSPQGSKTNSNALIEVDVTVHLQKKSSEKSRRLRAWEKIRKQNTVIPL